MLELECPAVTPEVVLQASGHVERFTDFMVTDLKTGRANTYQNRPSVHSQTMNKVFENSPSAILQIKSLLEPQERNSYSAHYGGPS